MRNIAENMKKKNSSTVLNEKKSANIETHNSCNKNRHVLNGRDVYIKISYSRVNLLATNSNIETKFILLLRKLSSNKSMLPT